MSEQIPLSGELLEVVNNNGRPTGEVLDKNIVHSRGLLHRVAHVWITNGSDVLQQRRGIGTKIMPGKWDATASGHVDPGETYVQAARRELREEVGLDMPGHRFRSVGVFKREEPVEKNAYRHHVIGDNFVVLERNLALNSLSLEAGDVLGARWYPIDQLEEDLKRSGTAAQHAPHQAQMYRAVIAGMRAAGR